ncbi:MAG: hypothetical protein ACRERZ_03435, partial [Gammaproteobacteria bacterium]
MTRLFGIVTLLLAMGVAGCSTLSCGDPHPYINSSARPPLQAPTGLSVPAPDPSYEIQGVTTNANKRTDRDAAGVCLINPPQLIGAQAAVKPKSPNTAPKSGPVLPPAANTQPISKPASVHTEPAPTASTA